jgi:predicted O-methyltransferase YrrM
VTTLGRLQAEYGQRAATWSDIVDWLPTLHDTVAAYPQATVVELGVRSGNSTAAFLLAVAEVDGSLWSADIADPRVPGWWAETGLWTLCIGDDTSDTMLEQAPAEVDVLFIDTSHHYEHTLAELRAYVPRVKPGGTVLMHDIELEMPEGYQGPPFPVARAIDDYCAETGLTWERRTGCYGLGIIKI